MYRNLTPSNVNNKLHANNSHIMRTSETPKIKKKKKKIIYKTFSNTRILYMVDIHTYIMKPLLRVFAPIVYLINMLVTQHDTTQHTQINPSQSNSNQS